MQHGGRSYPKDGYETINSIIANYIIVNMDFKLVQITKCRRNSVDLISSVGEMNRQGFRSSGPVGSIGPNPLEKLALPNSI